MVFIICFQTLWVLINLIQKLLLLSGHYKPDRSELGSTMVMQESIFRSTCGMKLTDYMFDASDFCY